MSIIPINISWKRPCKAMTPECGYYGPTTTNINKAPVRIDPVGAEELNKKYKCATKTGYPSCLIPQTPGGRTCKVAVNKEMADKFYACVSAKSQPGTPSSQADCPPQTNFVPAVHPVCGPNERCASTPPYCEGEVDITPTTAGLGGANLAMIAIVGGFIYYAYSQGLLKK